MATITLTDRISVRVTAKDSTETSNQNKTNGGNVASALGGSDLTDSEKEELGESLGETVTDENGTTYARSDKVAGVLKQLKEDGKIGNEPEYDDYVHNGYHYLRTNQLTIKRYKNYSNTWVHGTYYSGSWTEITIDEYVPSSGNLFSTVGLNASGTSCSGTLMTSDPNAIITWYSHKEYDGLDIPSTNRTEEGTSNNGTYSFSGAYANKVIPDAAGLQTGTLTRELVNALLNEEPIAHHGGMKIDPTGKTDAQIQKDLEEAAAANNAIRHFSSNPTDTYVAVTDANGDPLYFLGT